MILKKNKFFYFFVLAVGILCGYGIRTHVSILKQRSN
jgi:hypothetical protein